VVVFLVLSGVYKGNSIIKENGQNDVLSLNNKSNSGGPAKRRDDRSLFALAKVMSPFEPIP